MLRLFRRDNVPPAEVPHFEISHGGEIYHVAVRRVRGARRFTLRVRAATRDILLTMPMRGSQTAARDFALRHAAWISVRLERLPCPVPFAPDSIVPLRGIDHRIVHRRDSRGTVWVEPASLSDDSDSIQSLLCVAGRAEHVERRVADFLKREARRDLEAAVKRHAAIVGVPPRRVTIRDTTSRWGSCSAAGSLNFSWRLIIAPAFVLDYLAAHEVAHLVHMNHSAKFWTLTQRLAPQTERAEAWLKLHGSSLHRFGGAPLDADLFPTQREAASASGARLTKVR
ncbi:MAG TPA: SprT family zinc-dependent metalloprotease [Beijerinckiaceae bacterium]|nr:SprT family zinc-dependent metalloprotease [Beijerinckiaceae bacterium]